MADSQDKIELTVRVAPDIRAQADAIASANGVRPAEQYRQLFLAGLRAEQAKLAALNLIRLSASEKL